MPRGYWIASLEVTDPDGYKAYVAANAEPFRRYGARFLVRGGKFEAPEGQSRSRNVLLEFADHATALACYRSPEYARAKALRDGRSAGDLIVIEGHDSSPSVAADAATPKGYWIARVDVTEPQGYQSYVTADGAAFDKYGARFLVRGGKLETMEGMSRSRNVVIEFRDFATARACYDSPEYQRAAAFRKGRAIFDLIIIEGYVGPQPGG
jgi:uncharacterized protein (DUF1330 family)